MYFLKFFLKFAVIIKADFNASSVIANHIRVFISLDSYGEKENLRLALSRALHLLGNQAEIFNKQKIIIQYISSMPAAAPFITLYNVAPYRE